ncbi:MAG TPA: twin-arginine translocase subunit TatC, partial [Promineifilum sp.]|nr:twin-arginine translocase subunit TatC [Promineifilum sp.]
MTQIIDEDAAAADDGGMMSILDHLNELRRRLTFAAIAILITTVFSFIFAEQLLAFLLAPYSRSIEGGAALQTLRPTEGIETYFRVSLLSGIILAMPVILFEFWRFIRPALRKNE